MKNRKLALTCLSGGILAASLCIGTPVMADEAVNTSGDVCMEQSNTVTDSTEEGTHDQVCDNSEDGGKNTLNDIFADSATCESDQITAEEESDSEQDTSSQEKSDGQEEESPDEAKETPMIKITQDTLYQDEETTLSLEDFSEEDAADINLESIWLTIPEELKAGKILVPSFEDAETKILADGTELQTNESEINLSAIVRELLIQIRPLKDVLKQLNNFEMTLSNESSTEKVVQIQSNSKILFKDGTEIEAFLGNIDITLKGIRSQTDAESTPDPDIEDNSGSESAEKPEVIPTGKNESSSQESNSSGIDAGAKNAELIYVYKIIDNSGLNLLNTNMAVAEEKPSVFIEAEEADGSSQGTDYFDTEKIETAPVIDVSDRYTKADDSVSNTDTSVMSDSKESAEDPVTSQEKEMGMQEIKESTSRFHILPFLLVIAAAAGVIFVPLAKRRHSKNEKEEGRKD